MTSKRQTSFTRVSALVTVLACGALSILATNGDRPTSDWSKCHEWSGQLEGGPSGLEFKKNFYFFLPDGKVYSSTFIKTQAEVGTPEVVIDEVLVRPGSITGDVMVTVGVKLDANEQVDYQPCIRASTE